MEQSLQACGLTVNHKTYEQLHVSHASFVTDWKPLPLGRSDISEDQCTNLERGKDGVMSSSTDKLHERMERSLHGLPAFAQDIVTDILKH